MKKALSVFLSVIIVLSCVVCLASCVKEKADTIIYGNFYTSNDACEYAEAVAVKDGRFIYVGTKKGAKAYIGSNTVMESFETSQLITAGCAETTETETDFDPIAYLNDLVNGTDAGTDEKLSRKEALKAMSAGIESQAEGVKTYGTIEVGKDAMLLVFSRDLLTIDDADILSTTVVRIMSKGVWTK